MRTIAAIAGIWLGLAVLALAVLWPSLPRTSTGWLALLIVGPPLYLLGEALSAAFWNLKMSDGWRLVIIFAVAIVGIGIAAVISA